VATGGTIVPGSAPNGTQATGFLSITDSGTGPGVQGLVFDTPSAATFNTPQITFNLGSGTAPTDGSGVTFTGSSSYIKLTSDVAGEVQFNNNIIQLADLTNGLLTSNGAYLLFQAASNSDYAGLTVDGSGKVTGGLYIFAPANSSYGTPELYEKNGDIYAVANPASAPATQETATDTPVMPQWGIIFMAGLLVFFAARPKDRIAG
jgi:hypothetical protein